MLKKLMYSSLVGSVLLFSGCATIGGGQGYTYTTSDSGKYSYFQNGTVDSARDIELSDNGVGTVLGAVVGGVVGNQFGGGRGKTVATVVGAGAGAYAGNQLGKNAGQELIIRMENGMVIKQINKGVYFRSGDRVTVEFMNGKVINMSLSRN